MNMLTHFKHVYQWNKKQFWLINSMSLISALYIHFFNPNAGIQCILVCGILIKITKSMRMLSVSPSAAADQDQFSWKFMQSLPFNRLQLVQFMSLCTLFTLSPYVVWYFSFQKIILINLFDFTEITLLMNIKFIIFLLTSIVIISLSTLKTMIEFPRLQFSKKNNNDILFYQSIRTLIFFISFCMTFVFLVFEFGDNIHPKIFDFLGNTFQFIQNNFWNVWTLLAVMILYIPFLHNTVQKVWTTEKYSYREVNWNRNRDLSLMSISILIAITSFNYVNFMPSIYRDNKFSKAIYKNDISKVRELLNSGEDINQSNKFGFTPVIIAAHTGHYDIFKLLIDRNAKTDGVIKLSKKSKYLGMNIFLLAVEGKNMKIIKYLSEQADYSKSASHDGVTALHIAGANCQDEVVDLLVSKGTPVNAQTIKGKTALHSTAIKSCLSSSVSLIESGIDTNLKDKDGKSALDYAKSSRDPRLAYYLQKKSRAPAGK